MRALSALLPLLAAVGCVEAAPDAGGGPTPATSGEAARAGLCQVHLRCDGEVPAGFATACVASVTESDGVTRRFDGAASVRRTTEEGKPSYVADLRAYSEVPVWAGSAWSTPDDGAATGGWSEPGYDDTAWVEVVAPVASDAPVTYLRRVFDLHSRDALATVTVGLTGAPAAVVWVNGVELARTSAADGAWTTLDVPLTLLNEYTNVLAVELDGPTDGFDLWVDGAGAPRPADLLGTGAAGASWTLDGLGADPTRARGQVAADALGALGDDVPGSRLCELELDGAWQGVYAVREDLAPVPLDEVASDVDAADAVDAVLVRELVGGGELVVTESGAVTLDGVAEASCDAAGWAAGTDGIEALRAAPGFGEALAARWAELRAGALSDAAVDGMIGASEALVAPVLADDAGLWPAAACPLDAAARLAWIDANVDAF